jgi:hypothetical protein
MSTSRRVKIDPGASRHGRPYHPGMIRGGTLVLSLLLGCSASGGEIGAPSGSDFGGTGGTEPGTGGLGESGAPSEPTAGTGGGTAGTGGSGSPDLCQAGDERLCSCAPGYGGKQTCSDFGWNLCVCPDWPPDSTGGSGGSGGAGEPMTGQWWAPCVSQELCNTGYSCRDGRCTFDCRDSTHQLSVGLQNQCESLGGTCSSASPMCQR